MGDAYWIVERLGEPPFNRKLDLLSFSEKTTNQLLELLGDVVGAISPKLHAAGAVEAPDAALDRTLAFLRVVKYTPPTDWASFRGLLAAGSRDAAHPLLRWLLAQAPLLSTRAYVGHHLTMPEMPEELAYDATIAELRAAVKDVQPAFIEAHKAADAARRAAEDLGALKARVKQLEDDKDRLAARADAARAAALALPGASVYASPCTALRREHDEEVAISERLAGAAAALDKARARTARASAAAERAAEVVGRGALAGGDGSALVEALKREVAALRVQVDERHPRDIEARQRRLAAVEEALAVEVGGEAGLQQLSSQAAALQRGLDDSSARLASLARARQGDRADLQVRQAQQMAALASKRRTEAAARVERLSQARDAARAAISAAAAAAGTGADGGGGGGGISDAEWRAKYESVKAQLAPYKTAKKELAALEAEAFVLARTLAVLGAPDTTPLTSGAASTGDAGAGSADDLEQLRAAVAARKAELAPRVAELRGTREAFQELESRLSAAREEHGATVGPLEAECTALEAEIASLERGVHEAAKALPAAEAALAALDDTLERVAAEGGSPERLKQRSEQRVVQAESELRALRERQRAAAAAAAQGTATRAAARDMAAVLSAKLAAARGGDSAAAGSDGKLHPAGDVRGGADVAVF